MAGDGTSTPVLARAGEQLLGVLEGGAPLRKKWATHMSRADVAVASKTTRHVRCYVREGRVCLRYQHQVRAGRALWQGRTLCMTDTPCSCSAGTLGSIPTLQAHALNHNSST